MRMMIAQPRQIGMPATTPMLLRASRCCCNVFEVCCGNWNCRTQHDWVLALRLMKGYR